MVKKHPPIYTSLSEYTAEKKIRLSAPGHKGNIKYKKSNMFYADINPNEIAKNSKSDGILQNAQNKLTNLYKTVQSYYLTNGSDCGVHIMAAALLRKGDKILIDRFANKSIIQSVCTLDLVPVFIERSINHQYGFEGGLNVERLEYALSVNPDAKAVFVQSVTPYGIVSDMARICDLAHEYNVMVLCDETYGGHFSLNSKLPLSALDYGADAVVQSASETLGSLNGGAVLHINNNTVDLERVNDELQMYQTNNVSSAVLSTVDSSIYYAFSAEKKFNVLLKTLDKAKKMINSTTEIYWLDNTVEKTCNIFATDPLKITLSFAKTPLTGYTAYDILKRKHKIECDFADSNNVVLSASLYSRPYDIHKLTSALVSISNMTHKLKYQQLEIKTELSEVKNDVYLNLTPYDAYHSSYLKVKVSDCQGYTNRRVISRFPTMIPIIQPGERITGEHIELINTILDNGGIVDGINNNEEIDIVETTGGIFDRRI